MATWGEKFNKVTQNAISKSKEMAEVTKLNIEVGNLVQKKKDICQEIGEYVLGENLLLEDEHISSLRSKVEELDTMINTDKEKINDIKNINICPNCGAEVSRDSRFCDKCGTEIVRKTSEDTGKPAKVCPNCGQPLEDGALFCGNCGTRQDQG